MKEINNCIVVTNKSHCSKWLYTLNDNFTNLIFVDPEDRLRLNSLIDSVEIDIALVHLQSQDKEPSPTDDSISKEQTLNTDLALIEDITSRHRNIVVIAVVETVDQNLVLSIIRAGARDIIRIGTSAHETQAIINRHQSYNKNNAHTEAPKLAHISTLINARVSDGNPLFAIHMAVEMQRCGSTLLLDIGKPNADTLLILGLTAKFSLLDVINNRSRLDNTLIETGFAKHKSGLSILSLPDSLARHEVFSPTDLQLVLSSLKRHFQFIFINFAGETDPELLKIALGISSSSYLLMEQTIPSCKRNHEMIENLRHQKIAFPELHIVIDRHLPNTSPSPERIAKSFGLPLGCVLPSAGHFRLNCINTGETFFEQSRNNSYIKAIKQAISLVPTIKHGNSQNRFSVNGLISKLATPGLHFFRKSNPK